MKFASPGDRFETRERFCVDGLFEGFGSIVHRLLHRVLMYWVSFWAVFFCSGDSLGRLLASFFGPGVLPGLPVEVPGLPGATQD